MATGYMVNKGGFSEHELTPDQARTLFDEAQADPDSELKGTLESGFTYWVYSRDHTVKLMRLTIRPL